jgi:phospholipid/cholesterol/gamma-HCH transport system substrate-binding protein
MITEGRRNMPQRKELTWGQLRVGLMVGIALLILVIGIFFISGQVGFLRGSYILTAYFPEADGVRDGAQVQLAGVPVGSVSHVRLSNSHDPNRAVEVIMKVSTRFKGDIRTNSVATIQTAGLLGESYVDISRGSVDQPPLQPGGEVKTQEQPDIKDVVKNANDVLSNLTTLSAKLNDITNQIQGGRGTIGKFIYDAALYNRLDETVAKLQNVADQISEGHGTLGQLVSNDALYRKLNSTLDHANQMMDQIQHGQGTLARLMNDPSLYNHLNTTVVQARDLMTDINQGKGTLGKLVKDPQLYNRLNTVAGNVDTITQRMKNGQGSLGLLSTDNKLYNNLSASAVSLREFLNEFRKNPRKYLTLHLHIF